MCGIFGIAISGNAGMTAHDVNWLCQMGVVTSLRGAHSSGLMWGYAKEPDKCHLKKMIGDPFHWIHNTDDMEKWAKAITEKGKWVIGHGRFATRGSISVKNAHPFREGKITLVHNGTVDNLLQNEDDKVEVDSHALCQDMDTKGVIETLENLRGAAALVWHNAEEGGLFVFRNHQRDLHYIEAHSKILIMSEREALNFLMIRNKDSHLLGKTGSIKIFEPNVLYRITADATLEKVLDVEERKRKRYWPPAPAPAPAPVAEVRPTASFHSPNITPHMGPNIPRTRFRVVDIQRDPKSGECIYCGVTDKGEEVRSRSSIIIEPWKNRYGTFGEHSVVYLPQHNRRIISVRFKTIDWDPPGVDETKGLVETLNGKKMSANHWRKLCDTQLCDSCNGAIDWQTVSECCVNDESGKTKLMCPTCSDDIKDLSAKQNVDMNTLVRGMLQ